MAGGKGSSDLSSHELFGEKQLSVVACVTISGRVLGLVRPVLWDLAGCDPLLVLVPHPDVQFTGWSQNMGQLVSSSTWLVRACGWPLASLERHDGLTPLTSGLAVTPVTSRCRSSSPGHTL